MELIRGELPEWAASRGDGRGYGDGYGSGYGDGSGCGYGRGYGDGYGSGYGDGRGYGDGYGDGDGSGSGYGYGYGDGDVARCAPSASRVTVEHLRQRKACGNQVQLFQRIFPEGATWPDDIDRAREAGLDIEWARVNLGLLLPI